MSREIWHFEHENLIESWADPSTRRTIIEVLSGSHNIKTKQAHISDISPILTNLLMAERELWSSMLLNFDILTIASNVYIVYTNYFTFYFLYKLEFERNIYSLYAKLFSV